MYKKLNRATQAFTAIKSQTLTLTTANIKKKTANKDENYETGKTILKPSRSRLTININLQQQKTKQDSATDVPTPSKHTYPKTEVHFDIWVTINWARNYKRKVMAIKNTFAMNYYKQKVQSTIIPSTDQPV